MNKLIVLSAVVALATVVSSASVQDEVDDTESQFAVFEDDETEVKYLSPEKAIYADFCLRSRDKTRTFLKEKLTEEAMRAFNILFKAEIDMPEDMDDEVANIEDEVKTVAVVTKEAIVAADSPTREETVDEKIKAVEEQFSLIKSVKSAGQMLVEKAIAYLSAEAARRLDILKSQFTKPQIISYVQEACDYVERVKFEVGQDLQAFKSELRSSMPVKQQNHRDTKTLLAVRVEDVGCVTTARIATVSKVCVALPAIRPFFE